MCRHFCVCDDGIIASSLSDSLGVKSFSSVPLELQNKNMLMRRYQCIVDLE